MFKRKDVRVGYIVKLRDGRIMEITEIRDARIFEYPLWGEHYFKYEDAIISIPNGFKYEDIECILSRKKTHDYREIKEIVEANL